MHPTNSLDHLVGDEEALRTIVLAELRGGLWHTTSEDRYAGILAKCAILPEPEVPDSDRWMASEGRECWPYARFRGGVSLFDMSQFDPEVYSDKYEASWEEFIPYRHKWQHAVWIEIDRAAVAQSIISSTDLFSQWKDRDHLNHCIMPDLEAAHIGPLPVAAFKRVFTVHNGDDQVRHVGTFGTAL